MSFELNFYVVEFDCAEGKLYWPVAADDVQEAIHSIKNGWPEAEVQGVYRQVWWPEDEE
jgi:hypothetical protein